MRRVPLVAVAAGISIAANRASLVHRYGAQLVHGVTVLVIAFGLWSDYPALDRSADHRPEQGEIEGIDQRALGRPFFEEQQRERSRLAAAQLEPVASVPWAVGLARASSLKPPWSRSARFWTLFLMSLPTGIPSR